MTLDAVRYAIETEDKAALMDSLIICKFLRGVFEDFYAEAAEMMRAVTGWDAEAWATRFRALAPARGVGLFGGVLERHRVSPLSRSAHLAPPPGGQRAELGLDLLVQV